MRKKLLWIALALMMLVALPACNKKSDTDMAKESIEGFMTAIQKLDVDEAQKHVLDKDKGAMKDDDFMKDMDNPENKLVADIFKSAKFKFKSGEIKDGAEDGTMTYTITSKDFMGIMTQSMDDIMAGKSDEEIMAGIDVSKLEDKTKDVEIAVKKEGDTWKVADPETIMMEMAGMGDMAGMAEGAAEADGEGE